MPAYYEDKPVDSRPCAGLREDLRSCLVKSDCVKAGNSAKVCLRTDSTLEPMCRALQMSFFECKRSLLDNRTRFRGRKGY
ncbi:cytochrome c oxidase assembly factor 5 [Petromyzon marinus]|uniref:Cytochrome c oxidase assembly factor 5 n=1 Tax=Petromyzon marinus TaxID=7757 RepID=A0AAJ7T9E2_PETMA|nr:cytochrome c oxidase assembly factor 5 [Petromyzon marinus]XP_061419901.1 cytochrome c oxidase assembly factor 5 [Lethenteron reissneri]XP_061419902.1 cytochrome c oxidase assembly factor 5 [Lethenteron reissneri]